MSELIKTDNLLKEGIRQRWANMGDLITPYSRNVGVYPTDVTNRVYDLYSGPIWRPDRSEIAFPPAGTLTNGADYHLPLQSKYQFDTGELIKRADSPFCITNAADLRLPGSGETAGDHSRNRR